MEHSSGQVPESEDIWVGVDGSVFHQYPNFSQQVKQLLVELTKKRVQVILTQDGSGKGAAIIAAIACHAEKRK